MFETIKTVCPQCGEEAVVPVAYGYPGPAMLEAAQHHRIILGGCDVPGRNSHGCTACGWRDGVPGGWPSGLDHSADPGQP